MAKVTLDNIGSGYQSTSVANNNNNTLENELNNKVLYRDNPEGEANEMLSELDMNNQRIINLPNATSSYEPATFGQLTARSIVAAYTGTAVEEQNASAGQTAFTLTTTEYAVGGSNLSVYINGIRQEAAAYSETSTTIVTFVEGLSAGDRVAFIVNERPVDASLVGMASVVGTVAGSSTDVLTELNAIDTEITNINSRKIYTFDTVAAMVAAVYLNVGDIVITAGYISKGDGGSNQYEIVAAATGTDDGGSFIDLATHQAKGLFPDGVNVQRFGAVGDGVADDTAEIQAAIDYVASLGGGILKAIPTSTYLVTGITIKEAVVFDLGGFRGQSVTALATGADFAGATLKHSGTTGNTVTFPSIAFNAKLMGGAIDASSQTTSGAGVVFDDADGTQRAGQTLQDTLVYKGKDFNILIDAGNKEANLRNVFSRGGDDKATAVTNVGIQNNSVDVTIDNVWSAFCVSRCIEEKGGATRVYNSDFWGCQGINIESNGSTSCTWSRVQSDSAGGGGLLLNNCDNQIFINYTSLENALDGAADDVDVQGDCQYVNFTNPRLSGSTGSIGYGFAEQATNVIQVSNGRFASTYTAPLNPAAEAYYDWDILNNARYPVRGSMYRVQLNPTNINFADNGGTPTDWGLRGSATTARELSALPTGHTTAVKITSGAVTVSGLQRDLTADIAKYKGMRIRVRGLFRGDGSAGVNDQRIELFDGVASTIETIPNDAVWNERSLIHNLPDTATNLQIRLVASNGGTAGKILRATNVIIEAY